jgi:hypothetical protein
MTQIKRSEPRAHHFAPQCWLAGFTSTGPKTGGLWVTDLNEQRQWQTTPPNAGHRRDFYRVSDAGVDPIGFEKEFAKIEDNIAPLLKELYDKPRIPSRGELEDLLFFAGLQYIRVPAFRPTMLRIADSYHRKRMKKDLKTREAWERSLRKAGIPIDAPGAEYERMKKFEESGQYTLSAENEWYLIRGFEVAANAIIPALKARHWRTLISTSGSFITSDNPVTFDGPKGRLNGFRNADIVLFTLNRFMLLCGTNLPLRPPLVSRKFIAYQNTFVMITADRQLYSHVPDFVWLDHTRKCQTDWRLFDKLKRSESH